MCSEVRSFYIKEVEPVVVRRTLSFAYLENGWEMIACARIQWDVDKSKDLGLNGFA
jgi:hypothetical protein